MKHVLVLLFALTGGSDLPAQQDQRQGGGASPDIPAFVARLDSLRQAARIPGLSVAVVKDHAIVLALGLGFADAEQRIPATAETPYDIASVAKPLSAVVALRLVEEGLLDLDRPMVDYSEWGEFCREFSQQPSIFARELRCPPSAHTLRHLLSHTATSAPGTRFSYNPVLYSWASRPIMAVADTSFSALVERYVFAPAGMTRSARKHRALPVPEDLSQLLAPPHRVGPSGAIERAPAPPPQGDGAAGGVIASVLDLARFDIALDRGVLVTAESRNAMLAPMRGSNGEALPYGLGWFVQEYQGLTLIWHSGWWEDAYSALYLKVPALDLSFIVLANSEGVWWDNPLDKAEVQHSAFAQAFLRAFVGRYGSLPSESGLDFPVERGALRSPQRGVQPHRRDDRGAREPCGRPALEGRTLVMAWCCSRAGRHTPGRTTRGTAPLPPWQVSAPHHVDCRPDRRHNGQGTCPCAITSSEPDQKHPPGGQDPLPARTLSTTSFASSTTAGWSDSWVSLVSARTFLQSSFSLGVILL